MAAEKKVESQPERPEGIQLQVSKLVLTNTHMEEGTSCSNLKDILSMYNEGNLFTSNSYPNNNNDLHSIPQHFHRYANNENNPYLNTFAKDLLQGKLPIGLDSLTATGADNIATLLKSNTLKQNAAFDMWCLCCDQAWLEFINMPGSRSRPMSFVESIPLTLWLCSPTVIDNAVAKQSSSVTATSSKTVNGDVNRRHSRELISPERENRRSRRLLKDYYSTDSESCESSSVSDEISSETDMKSSEQTTTSVTNSEQVTAMKLAGFNVVAKIGGTVKAHMNHFQYLFLMRFLESITNFQTQLNADMEHFLGVSNDPSTFSVPLVVPELEFVMISPYIAELLPFPTHTAGSPSGNSLHEEDMIEDELGEDGLPSGMKMLSQLPSEIKVEGRN